MLTETELLQERVRRGAELLDTRFPGWAAGINISTLQLGSRTQCVLGQLFVESTVDDREPYFQGLSALRFSHLEAVLYGFTLAYLLPKLTWKELTDLWTEEIQARRRESERRFITTVNKDMEEVVLEYA